MDWFKLWLQMQVIGEIISFIVFVLFIVWLIIDIFRNIKRK